MKMSWVIYGRGNEVVREFRVREKNEDFYNNNIYLGIFVTVPLSKLSFQTEHLRSIQVISRVNTICEFTNLKRN